MKILVIEDHPAQLKLAQHVLNAAGHDVSDARAAEVAFIAMKMQRPQPSFSTSCYRTSTA